MRGILRCFVFRLSKLTSWSLNKLLYQSGTFFWGANIFFVDICWTNFFFRKAHFASPPPSHVSYGQHYGEIIPHCLFSYSAVLHIHIYRMSNCDEFIDYIYHVIFIDSFHNFTSLTLPLAGILALSVFNYLRETPKNLPVYTLDVLEGSNLLQKTSKQI